MNRCSCLAWFRLPFLPSAETLRRPSPESAERPRVRRLSSRGLRVSSGLLLVPLLGLVSATSPQGSPPPKPTPWEIRVVDAATQEPASGAVVTVIPRARAKGLARDDEGDPHVNPVRRDARLYDCDADGIAKLPPWDAPVIVEASALGKWNVLDVDTCPTTPSITLSLLEDVTIDVDVLDADGRPSADTPLAVEHRSDAEPNGPTFPAMVLRRLQTGPNGRARVEHAQQVLGSAGQHTFLVPDYPSAPDVGLELVRPASAGARPMRWTLAPTSRLVLTGLDLPGARATVSSASTSDDFPHRLGGGWQRKPARDGRLVVSRVQVGVDVDYEVTWDGLAAPIHGRTTASLEPGADRVVAIETPKTLAVLVGRVLGDEGQALPSTELQFSLTVRKENSLNSRGTKIMSDAEGRFVVTIPDLDGDKEFSAELAIPWTSSGCSTAWEQAPRCDLRLPEKLEARRYDLGDVQLFPVASRKRYERASDTQLRALLAENLESGHRAAQYAVRERDAMLRAIERRGGKEWQSWLFDRLAAERGSSKQDSDTTKADHPVEYRERAELELLTVLRRIQGRGDPLAIEFEGPDVIEVSSFDLPSLNVKLRNVDAEQWPFEYTRGGDYRTGRLGRWKLEAIDQETGKRLACLPEPSSFGGGMYSRDTLAFGATCDLRLSLASYVSFDFSRTYAIRLVYHDTEHIADRDDTEEYVTFRSKPLTLRFRPITLECSRAQSDEVRRSFQAIDPSKPACLVRLSPADAKNASSSDDPVLRMLSAGYLAVPFLIDQLERPQSTAEIRAWALALLYDLTGLDDPSSTWRVLGSYVRQDAGFTDGQAFVWGGKGEGKGGGPDSDAQRTLVERWTARKAMVVLKMRD